MLRIKDWNTAYWGYIRTAAEPYPCHAKVNAFIGPSGGGKTTLMDALRIALGDARFENNRAMDHYIHPRSNWAVVRVAFWNREEEGRPFAPAGFHADEVTVCVRLDKTTGKCEREYYLMDGPFHDLIGLGQNPKPYKIYLTAYKEYLKRLEETGISAAFRRLMMMRPEDVHHVVDLQPHELFQRIFELKGQKEIQEKHDEIQQKVRHLVHEEDVTARDLQQAGEKLREYEGKLALFRENETRRAEQKRLQHLLLKRRLWDSRLELAGQVEMLRQTTAERDRVIDESERLRTRLQATTGDLDAARVRERTVEAQLKAARETVDSRNTAHTQLATQWEAKSGEVARVEAIPDEPIPELEAELEQVREAVSELGVRRAEYRREEKALSERISGLKTGQGGMPDWVRRFQAALAQREIPAVLLADCVAVRPEYEPWLEAIEALLGRERFRTVVPPSHQLAAKRLQEEQEYGARVSLPRASSQGGEARPLKGRYASVRSALALEQVASVGGYLDFLNGIYLVETVEEGHQLQQEGVTSLTRKGLLQDQNGAVFLKARELVCGRAARERFRASLEAERDRARAELAALEQEYQGGAARASAVEERLRRQQERATLAQLQAERAALAERVAQAREAWTAANAEYERLAGEQRAVREELTALASERARQEAELAGLAQQVQALEAAIGGYRGGIGRYEQAVRAAERELGEAGYDEQALAFLDVEVNQDRIFRREDGGEWTRDLLEARVHELAAAVERFAVEHREITAATVAMVEPQKAQVARLQEALAKARSDREAWEERLAAARESLRSHVRETMEQYIEEFVGMAGMMGARATGRFDQEGQLYTQWRLNLRLAFDGKELRPYYDPVFSKGQRAAISIMLLLAAVNNRREGTQSSLMFLDEPTSRVDDARANEIGMVLQQTNIQYFITHQVSASLNSVDWIDHGYVITKMREGQEFADDPIFEARRALGEV